jgi:hypothetical protein
MKDPIARKELIFVTTGLLVGQLAPRCCNPDMLNFHKINFNLWQLSEFGEMLLVD